MKSNSQRLQNQKPKSVREFKGDIGEIEFLREAVTQLEQQVVKGKSKNQILTAKLEQEINDLDRSYRQIEHVMTKEETVIAGTQRLGKAVYDPQRVSQDCVRDLELELRKKQLELDEVEARLSATEMTVHELLQTNPNEGAMHFELKQLKSDNAQLLQMLRQANPTAFSRFVEASGGNVRYVPSRRKKGKTRSCSSSKKPTETQPPCWTDWIPEEAFKVAHGVIEQTQGALSESIITSLLSKLNRIWSKREAKLLKLQRKKFTDEITRLKRQGQMKAPYSIVELNKQNGRLRHELQEANRQIQTVQKPTQLENGISHVEQGLKMYAKFQKEKSELQAENENLQKRITVLEQKLKKGESGGTQFLDGANWVSQKVSQVADSLRNEWKEARDEFYEATVSVQEQSASEIRTHNRLIASIETILAQFSHNLDSITNGVSLEFQATLQDIS